MNHDSSQYISDPNTDVILDSLMEYQEHSTDTSSVKFVECVNIYRWIYHNRTTAFNVFILLDEMPERRYLNLNYFLHVVYDMYQNTPVDPPNHYNVDNVINVLSPDDKCRFATKSPTTSSGGWDIEPLSLPNGTTRGPIGRVEVKSNHTSTDNRLTRGMPKFTTLNHISKALRSEDLEFKSSSQQWVRYRGEFLHINEYTMRRLEHILAVIDCRILN